MDDLSRLAVTLAAAGGAVGALVATAVRKTSADIEATSKAFAPVDTGALMGSIGTTIDGDGRTGSIVAEIGPTVDYGEYVERGTSTQGPAAFMGPAFDRHAHQLETAAGQLVGRLL